MIWKHHLRREMNFAALKKCCLGKYDEALEILSHMQPYYMLDKSDLFTLRLLSFASSKCGHKLESTVYRNSYRFFSCRESARTAYTKEAERKSQKLYQQFFNGDHSDELLNFIIEECVSLLKTTEAAVFLCLLRKNKGKLDAETEKVIRERYSHILSFAEAIESRETNDCIVLDNSNVERLQIETTVLCIALAMLKFDVTVISQYNCGSLRVDDNLRIKQVTIAAPFENGIIDFLHGIAERPTASILFGEHAFLQRINDYDGCYRFFQMLHRNPAEFPYYRRDCLLVGNFYATKSFLYRQNVKELLFSEPVVDYSIVIPARNSAKYLKYAVESCINQDYAGTYEVLISDNSDIGNDSVFQLVRELNNPKIRYIKTPFSLQLAESFEYAYLNARGDKIISIGSDDGLIDCALSVLDKTFCQFPDNNIVHYEGTFYQWPQGDEDGYLIVNHDNESIRNTRVVDSSALLQHVLKDYVVFTEMPILYMHTCIRKKLIHKIIAKTGKFEYGNSQDVYTGVLNLLLEKNIIYIPNPLLVGGNSGIGVGQRVRERIRCGVLPSFSSELSRKEYYSERFRRNNSKDIISDKEHFFIMCEYEKIMGMGVFDKEVLTEDDYLDVFENIYSIYPLFPKDLDLLIKQMDRIAQNRGEQLYKEYCVRKKEWLRKRTERENAQRKDKAIIVVRECLSKQLLGKLVYSAYQRIRRRTRNNIVVKARNNEDKTKIITSYRNNKINNVYMASKVISDIHYDEIKM